MNKGYVYIARLIDHSGKFVNGYHKIGLSKQYKVRETQLNSTHLPFDVLMIRVLETEDMNRIESLLHLCFEDYRVVKEYDYRKNITTEWFDVSDIEMFNERIDKFIDLMGLSEIDMSDSIDKDSTLTEEEKTEAKVKIGRAKSTNLKVTIGNVVYFNDTAKETYVNVMEKLTSGIDTTILTETFSQFIKRDKNEFNNSLADYNKVLMENGLYMSSWGSNVTKIKRLESVAKHVKIDIQCEII